MNAIEPRPSPGSELPCASEACGRPAEPGETYCAECGLERSLFVREGGGSESDRRVEILREAARRIFFGQGAPGAPRTPRG